MEHVPTAQAEADHFGEMNAGTAADHWQLGVSHLKRAASLALFGPGDRPAGGADVTDSAPAPPPPAPGAPGANSRKSTLAKGYEEDGGSSDRLNGVFLPTQSWKETWDMVVLMFILYSAITVPYRICFDAAAEGYMFIFEQVVTFSFLTDVCFNFNTAYMDEDEQWVLNRKKIAVKYMSGWFWIDAPSSVPIELIDMMMEGDSSQLGMLRFLRLFRLLRLLRLLKLGEYIATLEIKYDLNLTFLRICQMVMAMIFLAHMLGCFWFYVAAVVGINEETTTWVSSYDDGSAMYADPSTQYLYAVYWALTTLTTVGYGDITPTNNPERMYSLFSLLTGALVFGFMLSSIGSLVSAMDRQAALNEEKMDEVKEYMRWRNLPRDLVMRMRKHYSYYYTKQTAFDEQAILGALTPGLRFEVISHTLKETIGKIPLFAKTLDPLFQMEVFPLLSPVSASPKEHVFVKGDASQALFFLIKGQIEVISGVDARVLYRIKPGSFFGESVLTGRRRAATHRAGVTCDMMCLSKESLAELFQKCPEEGKVIQHAVLTEHIRKERMRNLSVRFLVRKMKEGDDEQKKVGAALEIQAAWNKYCDRKVLAEEDFDADAEAAAAAAKPAAEESPEKRAKTRVNPFVSSRQPHDGADHATDTKSLEQKLDRLERLLAPLLSKLDSANARQALVSDRGKGKRA